MSRRADDPPLRRADRPDRASRPGRAARGGGAHRLPGDDAQLRSGGVGDHVQDRHHCERRSRPGVRGCGRRRRGRVPRRAPGAALHRDQRRHRGAGAGRRDDGVRVDAVSLLRASGAQGVARSARRQASRRPDRNRRRLRRQGRVSVDDRGPCGAARAQVGPPREADLRPCRGHAGDDEAASGRHPAPHGRHAHRASHRDGD